ncbi:MAG: HEAT repeat domain-containing protein [Planctomycetaceae bacterium]|nr:HEAT repeat domain-containing protein [Planctomycetaceae bacterium]
MNGWIRTGFAQACLRFGLKSSRRGMAAAILAALALAATSVPAQEAQWIWSPEHAPDAVPTGVACHFRKVFPIRAPEAGTISIAADDAYDLYVNARRVASGTAQRKLVEHDVSSFLTRGANVIAIKVANRSGNTAALVARVTVKERNGDWRSYSTDASWKAELSPLPLWNTALYNDRGWAAAATFGELVTAAPASNPAAKPPGESSPGATANVADAGTDAPPEEPAGRGSRFTIDEAFEVQSVLSGEEAGSLTAMTFNEFGHILAAKEGGGLLLVYDGNGDKIPEKVRTYCDRVQNIQGILALNGEVFVTGEGPDGPALYRLADKDRDGVLENVRTLIRFECEVLEHGAHGVVLGPDGLIYVLLGNHAKLVGNYDDGSPHRDYYEGDLLLPRYEDPGGHAVGIKAPGGTIIRTDTEGSGVQLVAGGLRNPYDLAFNRDGELFIHDADMESDDGTSWYRPTRLCHVIPGGEYGWRSGWAKWPDYFVDSLPAALDTGRGSPAGIVVYNHFMYPARLHGTVFSADWSQGRILAIKLKRSGASYTASSEVFLEGNPLNVTDLEVGPDGWLYFTTGGRGTGGGIYRVVWRGQVPAEVTDLGTGLTSVIRQPQVQASYSRQNIAAIRKQMGSNWDHNLIGVARSAANPAQYRLQALDLMQLFGPPPSPELLVELSHEPSELVRAKAAELMGLHASDETRQRLVALLDDNDRSVRRKACESLSRCDHAPPLDRLLKLLASDDRFEAFAARRVLERMPVDQWSETVLSSTDQRVLIQGCLALMIAQPSRDNGLAVLQQLSKATEKFVSDKNFIDLLRVMQVAIVRGELSPDEIPGLRRQLAEEFPAGEPTMNRELTRLLVYLQESSIIERYLAYLKSSVSEADKLHVAMHLRFLESGWMAKQRLALLEYYEEANRRKGGASYARYVINATRDFCKGLSEEESRQVLAQGDKWPNAALGALYKLPQQLDAELLAQLIDLDGKLAKLEGDSIQRLQVGIIAVLARSGDNDSQAYLRKIWEQSPDRRQAAAMGLAQNPTGDNWVYLVRSLPLLEPAAARQICQKLIDVEQAPEEAEPYRQAILLGLKMRKKNDNKDGAAEPAIVLLSYWTGQELAASETEEKQLAAWQAWFSAKYPSEPEAKLPELAENAKYTAEELLTYLASEEGRGAATRGSAIFTKAQCAKCHRFDGSGESFGPDLTAVSNRFSRKELVESLLFPSHVISSQYASKTIRTTDGRTITGLVVPGAAGETIVVEPSGNRVTLAERDVAETRPSKQSAMPSGLLDTLTLEEIADLFAYLQRTKPAATLSRRPVETKSK